MPFLITTRNLRLEIAAQRACDLRISNAHDLCEQRNKARASYAVITMDDAQAHIIRQGHSRRTAVLATSDGTDQVIAPDGTIIEIKRTTWHEVIDSAGGGFPQIPESDNDQEAKEIIAAYNEKQVP